MKVCIYFSICILLIFGQIKSINLQNHMVKKAIIYSPAIIGSILALKQIIDSEKKLNQDIHTEHERGIIHYGAHIIAPRVRVGREYAHLTQYYNQRDCNFRKAVFKFIASCTTSLFLNYLYK